MGGRGKNIDWAREGGKGRREESEGREGDQMLRHRPRPLACHAAPRALAIGFEYWAILQELWRNILFIACLPCLPTYLPILSCSSRLRKCLQRVPSCTGWFPNSTIPSANDLATKCNFTRDDEIRMVSSFLPLLPSPTLSILWRNSAQ